MYKLNIKILFFSFFGWLIASCSNQSIGTNPPQTNNQNTLTNQIEKSKEEKPLEKLTKSTEKIKLPKIKDFGVFDVSRESTQKNEGGQMTKPFYEAEIRISLKNQPKIGEKVTAIPLNVNLESFQLSITKTERKEEACTGDKKEYYWNTEIEKLTNRSILEIEPLRNRADEYPFEVAIIYPSVNFAINIKNSELSTDTLPKKVSLNTVKAAIDLDNDKKPDLLEILFCCSNPTETWNENTDCYICQKSFKKVSGFWKLVNSATPC